MRSRVDSRRLLDWREIALATAGMGDLLPGLQPGRRGLARPSQECGRVLRDSPCALHAQYWHAQYSKTVPRGCSMGPLPR